MTANYQLWYQNPRKVIHSLLGNLGLVDGIDYTPYCEFDSGKR